MPHRHAARVEPRDERPRRARWHKGARAVHVGHGLRHRRRHVGAGMELQLHDARALDALRLHVLDAGDVEKVILVVVREEALHLRRIHPAKRLRDVDRRDAERREHIARHARNREPSAEAHREHRDQDGHRAAERGAGEIHEGGGQSLSARPLQGKRRTPRARHNLARYFPYSAASSDALMISCSLRVMMCRFA